MDQVDWIIIAVVFAGLSVFLAAVAWVQGQLLRHYRRCYKLQNEIKGRLNQRVRELENCNRMLQAIIRSMPPAEPGSEADWWKNNQ